ncbi:peptide ABC transporter substrate-binding protein [Methylocella silvestris]|uniref:ABC transporter substrate-binding protein n=1 Tax=Methylocella silvestris TaxID=199596 RepID=A0A2J7TM49_METSI|nr:peptide ABC transporter substrate-binding protein [Methylocella silvestris]PNG27834.1 ABC transporter substrate-binding protein [Methylocella silvestris]
MTLPVRLSCALALCLALVQPAFAEMVWRRGALGDPGSLDPHKATTLIESNVLGELFEGLLSRDAAGALIPGVAESWRVEPDGRVYKFRLREDAKWSNGDPVTADDFVFAFRRLMDPKTGAPYANILYTLKNGEKVNSGALPPEALGARAVSERELELTLEQPAPYFLEQLAHFTAKPLHRKSIEAFSSDFAHPEHVVANGPFRLKKFIPNDAIVLEKNPRFWDAAKIALDREIFIPLEDRSAALRRFMAGEIDSYDEVPVEEIGFVRKNLPDALHLSPSLGGYYYALDTRRPPFDDVRVRQALSMAVDREFLAEKIWGGSMAPGYSFVPPGIASYGAPAEVAWKDLSLAERQEQARRLLKEAGFGEGGKTLEVEIRFNNSGSHRTTAVAIADMWMRIGVKASLIGTDASTHYALLREKPPFDAARMSWYADYPDAQNFLFLGESANKGLNTPSFSSPEFDALMQRAAQEQNPDARKTLLHEAEALLLKEQPFIVLMNYRSSHLVSPKLKGLEPNALDIHPGRYVSIAP